MVRGDAGLSAEDVQQIQAHVPCESTTLQCSLSSCGCCCALRRKLTNSFVAVDSEKEIRRMHKRFCRLDVDGTGKVAKKHFLAISELSANPLAERILSSMDEDLSDSIDFEEFVKALALFAPGSNPEERLSSEQTHGPHPSTTHLSAP